MNHTSRMMENGMVMGPLWMLVMAVLIVIPFWFIFGKAGFSKWLAILMLVPVVNLFMVYYLAFSDWPSRNRT